MGYHTKGSEFMKLNYPRYPVAFFPTVSFRPDAAERRAESVKEPDEKPPEVNKFGVFSNPFGTAFSK